MSAIVDAYNAAVEANGGSHGAIKKAANKLGMDYTKFRRLLHVDPEYNRGKPAWTPKLTRLPDGRYVNVLPEGTTIFVTRRHYQAWAASWWQIDWPNKTFDEVSTLTEARRILGEVVKHGRAQTGRYSNAG